LTLQNHGDRFLDSLWTNYREAGIESLSSRFLLGGLIDTMERIVEADMSEPG